MSTAAPRWGLGDAAVGWVLAVLAAIVAVSMVAPSNGKVTLGALAAGQVGLWAGLVGTVIYSTRAKGSGSLVEDFGFRFELPDVGLGLIAGVLCQLVLVPAIYIPLQWAIGRQDIAKPAKELAHQAHGAAYIGFAIAVAVMAPVIEELFFRGLVLRSLERRFGTAWAVVGSSVAFGGAHLQLVQLPALIAVGLVFGILRVRSGRLGPGIVAHAAFNAVAVVALAHA
jgi:membrane protease YdiL (CAAX protease family)